MKLELKNLYDNFRDGATIKAFAKLINDEAKQINKTINIMEVCGGHTHSIMKYALHKLLPNISILFTDRVVLCALCQNIELIMLIS